jgi:hypothetical protein
MLDLLTESKKKISLIGFFAIVCKNPFSSKNIKIENKKASNKVIATFKEALHWEFQEPYFKK